jgi:hypothetical protein
VEGSTQNWERWIAKEFTEHPDKSFRIIYTIENAAVPAAPEATSFLIWGVLGLKAAGCNLRSREVERRKAHA